MLQCVCLRSVDVEEGIDAYKIYIQRNAFFPLP